MDKKFTSEELELRVKLAERAYLSLKELEQLPLEIELIPLNEVDLRP